MIKLLTLACGFLLALAVFLLFNSAYYSDYQTNLLPGVYLKDGSSDLRAPYWSVPVIFDWNSDGRKDLLVGRNDKGQGHVSFYENSGTDSSPAFDGFENIQTCARLCTALNVTAEG